MPFWRSLTRLKIFKFRTTPAEELEDLQNESSKLKQTLDKTRVQRQRWKKFFIIYGFLIHLIGNLIYYLIFFPEDYLVRTYAVLSSIILVVLTYAIYWLMNYIFQRSIQSKEDRLDSFKSRKEQLIEEVKKKETYAVAKDLLDKYDDSKKTTSDQSSELRQRISIRPVQQPPTNIGRLETVNRPINPSPAPFQTGNPPIQLVRTILEPQRTWFDSILGWVVGEGPSNRYALICTSCRCHNGMALQEEFEYLSFRCAYCNFFNSARKEKPIFSAVLNNGTSNGTSEETTEEVLVDRLTSTNDLEENQTEVQSTSTENRRSESDAAEISDETAS